MQLRLGIDLDGVVADFNSGWISRYNEEFGSDIAFDAVQAWDGIPSLTHFRHMDEFWEWAADHGGATLFRHLDTYPHSVESLRALASDGHEIVILTAKPDWAVHDTFAWIAEHRLPTREVHILEDKWRVACDVYLDDAPHQVLRIHRARPESLTCRFVRPWNGPVPGTRDVHDWEGFVEVIRGLASGR
jgi:5'(3')-deoxyribonucleotidase